MNIKLGIGNSNTELIKVYLDLLKHIVFNRNVLSISATAEKCAYFIADFPIGNAFTDFYNFSRNFKPHPFGTAGRRWVFSFSLK